MRRLRNRTSILALTTVILASSCGLQPPSLATVVAQPNARATRNFTSFSGALRCMDEKLASTNKSPVVISSSDIPDKTKKISVGADDMLINAVGHMNRTSRKYVFLDQALVKDGGLIDLRIVAKKNPPRPDYYIRGSISQLDSSAMTDNGGMDWDRGTGTGVLGGGISRGRTVSVVSVDLHLVRFPSRQVVPGMSVANSMAVVSRGTSVEAKGLIDLVDLGLSIEVDRIESNSQAVRNLVELGVIELLGRHSGIPYWECLADPSVQTKPLKSAERKFNTRTAEQTVTEVQDLLFQLGHYNGPADGVQTDLLRLSVARFQNAEGLIADGVIDFDLIQRLRLRVTAQLQKTVPTPSTLQQTSRLPQSADDSSYQNLYHLLK